MVGIFCILPVEVLRNFVIFHFVNENFLFSFQENQGHKVRSKSFYIKKGWRETLDLCQASSFQFGKLFLTREPRRSRGY